MTVARVINNEGNVHPETVAKIKAIMKQIGYTPKPPGKRRGPKRFTNPGIRTGTIAFLAAHEEGFRVISASPVMNRVFHGVEEALSSNGMNLVQGVIAPNRPLPPVLTKGNVDGVVIWPDLNGASLETLECLKQYKIVYLMSGNNYKLPGDKVLPNNELIGEMAAEHLVKKGHKDLLFVTVASQHEKTTTMGKRWESFSKTARLLDASASLLTIDQKYEDVLGGRDASDVIGEKISTVFGGSCTPTGMFVCFDSLTATLYPILNKSGVKPGEDIEILSCNNEKSFLMGLDPMPISIDIHPELIGKRAVEQLIWRAGHPEDETNISIEINAELSI